jgi:hypothetical protein
VPLTPQLDGIARTVAPTRAVTAPNNATAARTGVKRIRARSIRRFIVASQHRGQPAKAESPYAGLDATGKSVPGDGSTRPGEII